MSETINIFLKGIFIPIGDVSIRVHDPEKEMAHFKGNSIQLTNSSNAITAIKTIELTPEEVRYIGNNDDQKPNNENLLRILIEQYDEIREFLGYLQAFAAIHKLDPELKMKHDYMWSVNNSEYQTLHLKWPTDWRGKGLIDNMADNVLGHIGRIASKGVPVFTAFRYLYQSHAEPDTRFKWINATIAAELAFKEFLSLYDNKMELLMLHIPSPPLDKLYNHVLEGYTGSKSSMYKKIQTGAQKRNDLVHKHKSESPSLKESNIYIHQVEVAIFELYKALYMDDSFFDYLLNAAKYRLEHVEKGGVYYQ